MMHKEIVKKAEERLNKLVRESESECLSKEIKELLLRFAIYQYDCKISLSVLLDYKPVEFARKVVLAKLAHNLFEFEKTFNLYMKRVLLGVAHEKHSLLTGKNLKSIKKKYPSIKNIEKFLHSRNKLSGHYDNNISEMLSSAEGIDEKELLLTNDESVRFYQEVIQVLIGRKAPPCI